MIHFILINSLSNIQQVESCGLPDAIKGCVIDQCTCDGCIGNNPTINKTDLCEENDYCRYKDQSGCSQIVNDQCKCYDKYLNPNEADCTLCSTCDLSGGSDACDQQWGGNLDWVSCLSDDWICNGENRIGNYGADVCPNPF